MAEQFASLDDRLTDFIGNQHIFFTATATAESRVNVSPRSTAHFRVFGPNSVGYLDLTGSGSETAAHVAADGRMTIMFCAVADKPMILRLYGRGEIFPHATPDYVNLRDEHFGGTDPAGARQIVRLAVDLVQTSCGYAVPLFDYQGERDILHKWATARGPEGIADYWREKNTHSIDGLPTWVADKTS